MPAISPHHFERVQLRELTVIKRKRPPVLPLRQRQAGVRCCRSACRKAGGFSAWKKIGKKDGLGYVRELERTAGGGVLEAIGRARR